MRHNATDGLFDAAFGILLSAAGGGLTGLGVLWLGMPLLGLGIYLLIEGAVAVDSA